MDINESDLKEFFDIVRILCERVSALDEEINRLTECGITDRLDGIEREFGTFTGGLNDIIDGRRKREYTDNLRTSKPEFGKYEGIGKRFGIDVYDTVSDKTFGMPEDQRDGAIGEMMKELSEKFDDLIDALNSKTQNTSETPEGGEEEIEVDTGEAPVSPMIEIARSFRKRAEGEK